MDIMHRDPPLRSLPTSLKLLSLVIIVICSFLLLFAVGAGISIPIFGKGILSSLGMGSGYEDPAIVAALKYFQVINQVGVFILPALAFAWLSDRNISGYLKLDIPGGWVNLLTGSSLILFSLPFTSWLLEVNQAMHLPDFLGGVEDWMRRNEDNAGLLTEAFLETSTWGGFLVNLFMIGVIAALGEELIFRGILVKLFHEWTRNLHLGVIISALLFSALHLQFFGFFPRLMLGILLGYLFVWTRSLWVPVVVHFVNNAAAVTVAFMSAKGWIGIDFESFGSSDSPLVIIGSLVITAGLMGLLYYWNRRLSIRRTA